MLSYTNQCEILFIRKYTIKHCVLFFKHINNTSSGDGLSWPGPSKKVNMKYNLAYSFIYCTYLAYIRAIVYNDGTHTKRIKIQRRLNLYKYLTPKLVNINLHEFKVM